MRVSRPTPDWKKRRVFLVDPAIWHRYTRSAKDVRPVYWDLLSVLREWGAGVEVLGRADAPLDIWIRDWGRTEGVFFNFKPNYAKRCYSRKAVNSAICKLSARLPEPLPFRLRTLVLDGGNLVHNGTVAIVTEKVFLDNPRVSPYEIEGVILSLGFERVIFIPIEPGDDVGHSDGMCRFVNKRTLLVNDYASASMASFGRKLRRVLRAAKLGVEMVTLPWFFRNERIDGVASAVGCYMNFLQLAQGIVMPSFANRQDERAREVVASLVKCPVVSVKATALARWGGVFNCISLTV